MGKSKDGQGRGYPQESYHLLSPASSPGTLVGPRSPVKMNSMDSTTSSSATPNGSGAVSPSTDKSVQHAVETSDEHENTGDCERISDEDAPPSSKSQSSSERYLSTERESMSSAQKVLDKPIVRKFANLFLSKLKGGVPHLASPLVNDDVENGVRSGDSIILGTMGGYVATISKHNFTYRQKLAMALGSVICTPAAVVAGATMWATSAWSHQFLHIVPSREQASEFVILRYRPPIEEDGVRRRQHHATTAPKENEKGGYLLAGDLVVLREMSTGLVFCFKLSKGLMFGKPRLQGKKIHPDEVAKITLPKAEARRRRRERAKRESGGKEVPDGDEDRGRGAAGRREPAGVALPAAVLADACGIGGRAPDLDAEQDGEDESLPLLYGDPVYIEPSNALEGEVHRCGVVAREFNEDENFYLTYRGCYKAAFTLFRPGGGKNFLPRMAKPDMEVEIKITTYNVWMMPTRISKVARVSPQKRVRAKLIPPALPDSDVIVFTECFHKHARPLLLDELKKYGYYYRTTCVGHKVADRKAINGGVVAVSRWPIVTVDQKLFRNVCAGDDSFADKGVLYLQVVKGGRRIHIFGSHTQAWNDKRAVAARLQQFRIIREFIKKKDISSDEPCFVTGDLNVNRWLNDQNGEYGRMLEALDCEDYALDTPDTPQFSFNPADNPLAASGPSSDGSFELLDYVLVSNAHKVPVRGSSWVVPIQSAIEWDRDGQPMRDLSDHYPVTSSFEFSWKATKSMRATLKGYGLMRSDIVVSDESLKRMDEESSDGSESQMKKEAVLAGSRNGQQPSGRFEGSEGTQTILTTAQDKPSIESDFKHSGESEASGSETATQQSKEGAGGGADANEVEIKLERERARTSDMAIPGIQASDALSDSDEGEKEEERATLTVIDCLEKQGVFNKQTHSSPGQKSEGERSPQV